eukprot:gene42738-56811_t
MIEILSSAALATVQDLGRTGSLRWGVGTSGAMDNLALAAGNLLLGNALGAAAIEVSGKLGLAASRTPKLVQGEGIGQTYNFAVTANAEVAFVAMSQVLEGGRLKGGSIWVVPQNLYAPIQQDAVLLKRGANNEAAKALMTLLQTVLLTPSDLQAIGLTLRVAALTTAILLVLGVPLAWWLARSRSAWSRPVGALVSIPLVLPPSVLGFYLLVLMGPNGPVGGLTQALGLGVLTFSFAGLVIASVFYSLPFMVQPVLNSMQQLGERPLEAAGDGATGLEVGVDRPRRDPLGPGLLHVKAAWSGFLVHPVGKGRNPMDEGCAAHGEVGVV